jgi:hypothetical protein
VDWFNISKFTLGRLLLACSGLTEEVTYDFAGVWDDDNSEVGPHVAAHTNLTQIEAIMDILWDANIDPARG